MEKNERGQADRRIGLALAGGGPEGAIYEIGALRAFEEAVAGVDLNDLHVYVGVSAGAFIAANLANGLTPAQMCRAIVKPEPGEHPFVPETFFTPAFRELARRGLSVPGLFFESLRDYLRHRHDQSLIESLTRLGRALPVGLFDNEPIRQYLHGIYTIKGRTDDFRRLDRRLFVVAADLDSGRAVCFGSPGLDHVPISTAVQASTALPGLYPPVEIDGRHYVDGVLLKTMHGSVALEAGAELLLCLNPIVPVDTARAVEEGVMRRGKLVDRGLPTVLSQALRTLVRSRLEAGMNAYQSVFDGAEIVLLEPKRDDYRMFFRNMFSFADRRRVCEHAYASTRRELLARHDELAPLLARHGLELRRDVLVEERDLWHGVGLPARCDGQRQVLTDLDHALDRLDAVLDGLASHRLGPVPSAPVAVPVAPVDRAWLRMDEPANRMHVHGVLVLAGDVEREAVERAVAERLAVIPRFRDRVGWRDGRMVWEPDPAFDVARHVVEERLPAGAGDAELAVALAADLPRPFDAAHPLWELRLLRGHPDGTIVFARLHHAIGDGIALMTVLLALTDFPAADPSSAAPADGRPEANPFFCVLCRSGDLEEARREAERLMPETLRLMLAPGEAMARLNPLLRGLGTTGALARLVGRPSDPPTPFKGPLGVDKRLAWTQRVPLADVKAIGRALGGTVNDVLNTAMAGGLRRYLEATAGRPAEGLVFRCAMPVSLRPLADMHAMGNRFGLVFLPLPVGLSDPERRLGEVHRRALALRRSAEPLVVLKILETMARLPKRAQDWIVGIFGAKATGVFTNVPGPRQTLYFAGLPIRDIFFWVPQAGRLGLGASILSYDGHVRMGVGTDAGLVPDPQRIVDGFHAELDALLRLS